MAIARRADPPPGSGRVLRIVERLEALDPAAARAARPELDDLAQVSSAIGAVRPNDFARNRIPRAQAELEAASREIAEATDRILTLAERLSASGDGAVASSVAADAIELFEACGFRDLVGQRLSQVHEILAELRTRLEDVAGSLRVTDAARPETDADERRRRLLLNGPGLDGPAVTQDAVDKLMEDAWRPSET
jgi:chemotaxis protein CheZ